MRAMTWILAVVLVTGIVTITGCKKKSEGGEGAGEIKSVAGSAAVDENKPIEQVMAEADKMDVKQLREMAVAYKAAIAAKKPEFQNTGEELKKAITTQLGSPKVTELNEKWVKLSKSLEALNDRMQVYVSKLKEKGGDMSGLN